LKKSSVAARKLKPYNKKDRSIRTEWREFFSKWGSHVVKSVYVGGACTVEISETELLKLDANFYSNSFERQKEMISWLLTFGDPDTGAQCNPPIKYQILFQGGDKTNGRFPCQFPPSQGQIKFFQDWKADFKRHPVALETNIELMPVSVLFKDSEVLTTTYDEAFNDLFLTMPSKKGLLERIRNFFNKFKSKKPLSSTSTADSADPTKYTKLESEL